MRAAAASLEITPVKTVGLTTVPKRHTIVTDQEEWLQGEHHELSCGTLVAQGVWTTLYALCPDHSNPLVMSVLAPTLLLKQLNSQQHIDAWREFAQELARTRGDISLTLVFNNNPHTTRIVSAPMKQTRKVTVLIWTREHFARHADPARPEEFHFISDPYVDILQAIFPYSTIPSEPNRPLAERFRTDSILVSDHDDKAPEEIYLIARHEDPRRNRAQAFTVPRVG